MTFLVRQSINTFSKKEAEWLFTYINPEAFTDYLHKIDVYEYLEDYCLTKSRRALIVFDDMIADIEANKKLHPIVTEFPLRGKKLNISRDFISQSYFRVPQTKTKCNTLFFSGKYLTKENSNEYHQIILLGKSFYNQKIWIPTISRILKGSWPQ